MVDPEHAAVMRSELHMAQDAPAVVAAAARFVDRWRRVGACAEVVLEAAPRHPLDRAGQPRAAAAMAFMALEINGKGGEP